MLTTTELRADIYRILDKVLATGAPIEVDHEGRRLRITAVDVVEAARPESRLDRLVPRPDAVTGDPDDLVDIDWSDTWQP